MLGVLLYHFLYYSFETVSLIKYGARMEVGQKALVSLLSLPTTTPRL